MRKMRGLVLLLLVHAATAKPEPLSKEELHKLSADDRTPYAGEYATELCSGKPPGLSDEAGRIYDGFKRYCEKFGTQWNKYVAALEQVCGRHGHKECPDPLTPELNFWDDYKREAMLYEAGLYDAEAEMAGLLGKRADGKRLKRHAAVTRATLAYERTGDGVRLLRLLEQATPKERRGFMVDTKGSRTKELFDRAETLEITIMELLKRDIHDRNNADL